MRLDVEAIVVYCVFGSCPGSDRHLILQLATEVLHMADASLGQKWVQPFD